MMIKRFLFLGSALAMVLTLTAGCTSIQPFIRDFNVIPISQEVEIGQQMNQELHKQLPVVNAVDMNTRVNQIGSRLVGALPSKLFNYNFYIVEDDSINAFTIPGGSIYVHTGLIKAANDQELAGVIAHEIGHAHERHPAKALSRAYGLEYLSQMLLGESQSQVAAIALNMAKGGFLLKYSRDDEREADEMAFHLLKQAGYSESGLIRFLQKLLKAEQTGNVPVFMRTHPSTQERIDRLQNLVSQESIKQ